MTTHRFLSGVVFAGIILAARADVTCPAIFGDHMVLQRDRPVPVWGRADPGEPVTVEFGGQSGSVTGDATGAWRVTLKPLAVSTEPRVLTVRGKNTLTFSDVLVGEVWFCSGQSNMEKPLGPRSGQKPTDNYEAELTRADCPTLRLFQVPQHSKPKKDDGSLAWTASSGDALMKTRFSAAAYYFGRELQRELGVPVGLIHSSFGGTRIEAWMPPEAFADPALRDLPGKPYQAWVKGVQATELYQSMVAPYVPFALRGFLWYQGEANVMNAEGDIYATKMRAMIATWRAAWEIPDAPFYFAQLAPFFYSGQKNWEKQLTSSALPAIWEDQIRVLDVPHTGIIPTSDLAGNGRDIHPTNKRDVGLRFARLALAETYGRKDIQAQAPRFKSVRYGNGWAEITFDHAEGLHAVGNPVLLDFIIVAKSGTGYPVLAEVVDGKVMLRDRFLTDRFGVRFAFNELAMPKLFNSAGLPALPFRTDELPLLLEIPKPPPLSVPADQRISAPEQPKP